MAWRGVVWCGVQATYNGPTERTEKKRGKRKEQGRDRRTNSGRVRPSEKILNAMRVTFLRISLVQFFNMW